MILDSHGKPVSPELLKEAQDSSIYIQFCLPWRERLLFSLKAAVFDSVTVQHSFMLAKCLSPMQNCL